MNIAVIGAGPAGMTAAGRAASLGAKVVLIEKNSKAGKKLYITGKGRCNVTNFCSESEFLKNVVTNSKFLFSSVYAFPPAAAMSLIEGQGVKLKVERGNRVFPVSDKSSDVIKALQNYAVKSGAELLTDCQLQTAIKTDTGFRLTTSKGEFSFDKLILCGGGISYKSTGSTGECMEFAAKLGHTLVPLKASLCKINVREDVSSIAGLTLKNARVKALCNGKTVYEEMGELLFTHDGISGPLPLTISALINKYESFDGVTVSIDIKPALDIKTLDRRLVRDLTALSNRALKNSLFELLPKSIIPYIIKISGIDGEKLSHSVTAEERSRLAGTIKALKLTVQSLDDIDRSVVVSGGVSVSEINPKTMESKLVPGLYFAGEMIDVDALTGGFNIQIALSTGYAAGSGAAGG